MARNADLLNTTTFAFCDNRAIRLAVNLHCPRCGTELKAGDVGADRCGAVVLVCGACEYNILTVKLIVDQGMRQTVHLTKLQFRRRLRQVGISQGAFARLVGVDRVTVNRWATGRLVVPQWVGVMLDLMIKAKEKGSIISGHARPPRSS